jgi:hypothetical protein
MIPLTVRMFDTMPPFYAPDSMLQGIMDALGRELQRFEDYLNDLRFRMFPQNADDKYRTLGMWEMMLGLPVEPTTQTVVQRRALVLARTGGQDVSAGSDWLAAMNRAMGGTPWSYQEGPGSYQVTLLIPFGIASFNSVQVLALARAITPAHIDVAVQYLQGFIVGEGIVGEDRL